MRPSSLQTKDNGETIVEVLFSVVISNYNYGRFLEDAIQSVIKQCESVVKDVNGISRLKMPTGELVELIVCDAMSEDNSVEIIKKYSDYISWWCSEKDNGQSAAFNKGFFHSTGRFLTWLNADDVFTSEAFSTVRDIWRQNPDCKWITGSTMFTDSKMRVEKCACAHAFSVLRAKYGFLSVWSPSSFFTRDLLNDAGGIDEKLHYLMDIDLWHKFFKCGARYIRTRRNLFAIRRHGESKTFSGSIGDCEKNRAKQNRAKEERRIVDARYGIKPGVGLKLTRVLNFSVLDAVTVVIRTVRTRGKDARYV